ncbi:hypothetical protein Taro_048101 [Colocasia esculenta]|uniref:Uncharacterized protein n=1 Tax=Colocasia esculenta TaxID=4460 RepID=A0A843WUV1_COLES|nr:hypothetical protein [Colocasia esculenta]
MQTPSIAPVGYNQLVDHVGIYGQRRLTEALNKDSLVRQKEYPTESSSKSRESGITISSTTRESMDRGADETYGGLEQGFTSLAEGVSD